MLDMACRDRGRRRKRQAAQVISSPRRLAASGEESSLVGLQKFDPVPDVARVPEIAVKAKLCTQERSAQFGDQFFGRVAP